MREILTKHQRRDFDIETVDDFGVIVTHTLAHFFPTNYQDFNILKTYVHYIEHSGREKFRLSVIGDVDGSTHLMQSFGNTKMIDFKRKIVTGEKEDKNGDPFGFDRVTPVSSVTEAEDKIVGGLIAAFKRDGSRHFFMEPMTSSLHSLLTNNPMPDIDGIDEPGIPVVKSPAPPAEEWAGDW